MVSSRAMLVVAVLVATSIAGCTSAPEPPEDPLGLHAPPVGLQHVPAHDAPDIETTTIDGEAWRLSDHRGKVVLIEFMGAGCSACRANLPEHQAMFGAMANESGFIFIGLSIWRENDDILRAYREEHDIRWPLAMAPADAVDEYALRGTPTHVFIDHEGRLHARGSMLRADAILAEARFLLDSRHA